MAPKKGYTNPEEKPADINPEEKPSSSDATTGIDEMTKIAKEQSQVLVRFKLQKPEEFMSNDEKTRLDMMSAAEALKECEELFNQMNPLAQKRDYLLLKNQPTKKEATTSSSTSLNLLIVLRGTTDQKDITDITMDMIYSKLKTKATDLFTMTETQKKNAVLFYNNEQIVSQGNTRLDSDKFVTQNKEGKKTRVNLKSGDVLTLVL